MIMVGIILIISLAGSLAFTCLRFGIPGLRQSKIVLVRSREIKGFAAKLISIPCIITGLLTGTYCLFGLFFIARHFLGI